MKRSKFNVSRVECETIKADLLNTPCARYDNRYNFLRSYLSIKNQIFYK